jgi:8-amino-7-oxononanoate synthase
VAERVPVRVGTLSKALGSLGGFVAGSRRLVDHLIHRSRTMIYSTATPPSCAAAAGEALRISRAEPWRRETVHRLADDLRRDLRGWGWDVLPSTGPIVPVLMGDPSRAMGLAGSLRDRGFLVGAIRPPTVPEGTSRLRISLSATHSESEIAALVRAMGAAL